MTTPLILTIQLDETSQLFFDEKRKQYFPAEGNFLSAHLSLFHHLPDDEVRITETIEAICKQQKPISLAVTEPKSIGKGVAYKIESKELINLHKKLQKEWQPFLTPQDQQGLWPHITIQNKVLPAEAKQTLEQVKENFRPFDAHVNGLILWRYLDGPWQLYQRYLFVG